MKTAIITVKTKPQVKAQAQKVAEELGFGLSTLINGFLNQLIKERKIEFSTYPKEEPSDFMIQALKEAEKDCKEDRVSPCFDNAEDAIKWLNRESKRYALNMRENLSRCMARLLLKFRRLLVVA